MKTGHTENEGEELNELKLKSKVNVEVEDEVRLTNCHDLVLKRKDAAKTFLPGTHPLIRANSRHYSRPARPAIMPDHPHC
jgi:hypothetical protein